MKNLVYYLFFLVLTVFIFSCSKESSVEESKNISIKDTNLEYRIENGFVHFNNYSDLVNVLNNIEKFEKQVNSKFNSLHQLYFQYSSDSTLNFESFAAKNDNFYYSDGQLYSVIPTFFNTSRIANENSAFVVSDSINIVRNGYLHRFPYNEDIDPKSIIVPRNSVTFKVENLLNKSSLRDVTWSTENTYYYDTNGNCGYNSRRRQQSTMGGSSFGNYVEYGSETKVQKKSGIFGNWLSWNASYIRTRFVINIQVDDFCRPRFNFDRLFVADESISNSNGGLYSKSVGIAVLSNGLILDGSNCFYLDHLNDCSQLNESTIYDPTNSCFHNYDFFHHNQYFF